MRNLSKKKYNLEYGQTLIEVLLALAIAVIVITSIGIAVITSLNNATYSKNQNLANNYAQEGMDVVRSIKDRSWDEFLNLPGGQDKCLPENTNQLVPRSGPDCDGEANIGVFVREVTIENNNIDCRPSGPPLPNSYSKVTVSVQWKDGVCSPGVYCHEARLISCFVKKVVSAP